MSTARTHRTWTYFFWTLAFAFAAFSALMNWTYAQRIWANDDTWLVWTLPIGFVLVDLLKFGASGLLAKAFADKRRLAAGGLLLFVVPFALLSIAATVQVSLEAQATMAGHTDTAKAKLEDLRAENAELKAERLRMGTVQTPDVIKRQMEAMEFDRRWTTSAGCTKATASASRSFCAEHRALFSKLAAANHATELRQRIDTLLDRIRNATTTETVTQHQAGLQAMADGAGIDKQVVAVIVMLAMGVA